MKKSEVEQLLLDAGFASVPGNPNFGDQHALQLDPKWKITAYASKIGNIFSGDVQHDSYEEVSFSLDGKGTRYQCKSIAALQQHLPQIIEELRQVSQNDELLRCPKCRKRYVYANTPPLGKNYKPFLSCEGMTVKPGSKGQVHCDGTSKALPAVVVFR